MNSWPISKGDDQEFEYIDSDLKIVLEPSDLQFPALGFHPALFGLHEC